MIKRNKQIARGWMVFRDDGRKGPWLIGFFFTEQVAKDFIARCSASPEACKMTRRSIAFRWAGLLISLVLCLCGCGRVESKPELVEGTNGDVVNPYVTNVEQVEDIPNVTLTNTDWSNLYTSNIYSTNITFTISNASAERITVSFPVTYYFTTNGYSVFRHPIFVTREPHVTKTNGGWIITFDP